MRSLTLLAAAGIALGGSPWGPVPKQRAQALVAQLNLTEKVALLHGYGMQTQTEGYIGWVQGNSRLNIPLLGLEDGPQGVADGVPDVTAFPGALTVAQTWDIFSAYYFGQAQAVEQKAKGTAVLLGPGTNLARVPWGGRNFEYLGEDPLFASVMASQIVTGIQSANVSACIKHFVFNNQEHNRDSVSANVPQRAAMELYLKPFWAAIDAGVGSAMCSYNRVNNTYACENDATINGYLKGQGGFEGFIMTDWFAGHSTVAAALAGLDMEMPAGLFFGDALVAAVQAGTVPESRVDDAITRVLTGLYAVGFMDDQPTPAQNLSAVATSDAHTDIARFLATQATVLLKNEGGLLPLDPGNLTQVAVLGDAAIYYGGGSGSVFPSYHITPYEAIFEALNDEMPTLRPASACSVTGNGSVATPYANNTFACMEGLPGAAACAQRCANISGCNGWSYIGGQRCNGWGWDINDVGACDIYAIPAPTSTPTAGAVSGICTPAPVTPTPGARVNVSTYIGPDVRFAAQVASLADVAIVNVAITCSEGDDRPNLSLYSWQNDLVAAVVAANPRTIVVVRAPGAVTMPWLASVPAVLYQGMPGQEAAHALSDAIFGVHNPSGKLPVSFPANETATWLGVGTINPEQYPGTVRNNSWPEADYTEELSIGYRYFDQAGTPAPLFPFGFGLSYTTFTYSGLSVTGSLSSSANVTVTLEVTNVGPRAGAEVVQLYVSHPEAAQEPPKVLAGFEKPYLQPGQSIRVKFTIVPRVLQVWNAVTQAFELVEGTYGVLVGSSSVDIRLQGAFTATA